MSSDTVPRWVKALYRLLGWMEDWRPLAFRWLPDRYRLMDDACGCQRCEARRAQGKQGPRRWGNK